MAQETLQTQALPATYNRDERLRKIEADRQLVEMEKQLTHLIDLNETQTKLLEDYNTRLSRIEITLYGKDFLNGLVQQVAVLTRMKLFILCTLSAIASSGLTLVTTYIIKHI